VKVEWPKSVHIRVAIKALVAEMEMAETNG
jgi:hypothetical protein